MFVTPAYAQTAAGGGSIILDLLPFILIFVIMYFLIIFMNFMKYTNS